MLRHGINTYKDKDPEVIAVRAAAVGIPFFIGAWPCHSGAGYVGKPQLASTFSEAEQVGGYSNEWRNADGSPKWNLCQAAYAHFKLMGASPAVFCNVYDPTTHKRAVAAKTFEVDDHIAKLPYDAILNDALIVKAGSDALLPDTDYEAYYSGGALCVELLEESAHYADTELDIAYDIADLSKITAATIEVAVEEVEKCRNTVGVVPDLLCAPGWSSIPAVAAVMAAKAPSINGLFRAKAVVDIDTSIVDDYSKLLAFKNDSGYTSEDMIVCWPMVKSGNMLFDLSAVVCGLIAKVDSGNGNSPHESPSNKEINITGAVTVTGEEVNLSLPQADVVSVSDGVVTVINSGSWTLWGDYLGCYPKITDTATKFISTNRVQDWICNSFVNTFWRFVDKPLTAPLRDAIIIAFNTWLNGLTAEGKLYGGQIEYIEENNPVSALLEGVFRFDTKAASPIPAQQIDMHVRYSVDMLVSALSG